MAADGDQAIVYDRAWTRVGEFRVVMTEDGNAAVRSGPKEVLQSGKPYMASIYGRYYSCTAEGAGDEMLLRLDAWSKGASTGAA